MPKAQLVTISSNNPWIMPIGDTTLKKTRQAFYLRGGGEMGLYYNNLAEHAAKDLFFLQM